MKGFFRYHIVTMKGCKGRLFSLVVYAFLSVLTVSFCAAAEASDPVIERALKAFKIKHPDLYEMIDIEKFTAYATDSHRKLMAAKKHVESGKQISKEEAAKFRISPAPNDLIKPEVYEAFKAKIGAPGGINPADFDPKNFDASKKEYWRSVGAKLKNSPRQVLGHVQSGDVESFPTSSEIKGSEPPKAPRERERTGPPKPLQFAVKVPQKMEELPNCPKDTSMKYQFGEPTAEESTKKDILFIRSEIPSVPDELFGKNVRVFQYKGTTGDPVSVAIKNMRVPCLPFRMRLSEHLSVQDFGLNALRNYDREFNGKGDLHPYVQKNSSKLLH